MKIRLNEIPEEGREYIFDRESGELDQDLADLVGKNEYRVELYIKPIGNAYEMRGEVETTLNEVCSYCANEFDLSIKRRVNEILFEEQEETRKGHSVHGNQSVDFLGNGPSMTPYKSETFEPGKYAHELIAVSEPFYPMCGPKETCLHADEVEKIKKQLEAEWAAAEAQATKRESAFAVLKKLNLEGEENH